MSAADLILKNANVVTMNSTQPTAELVAIRGNKILLVAGNEELESVKGARTKVIDCQGKTVVPGFNDAHCHLFSLMRHLLSVDLSPASVSTIADIKAAIRHRTEKTPLGRWITGVGFNEFYLAEKRYPTRWDIDEVVPDRPVVLSHRSLHACVLNSLALSLAGITSETPEPPGAIFARDLNTGEPNGVLYEMLGYIREKVLSPLTEEELSQGIALVNGHNLSYGITSLQEATIVNDLGRWQTLERFKEAGKLRSRVSMMFGIEALNQFDEAGLVQGSGDSRLRLGGVKVIVSEATGELRPPQSELNQQAVRTQQAGFQLAIHAVGQNQVEAAITALEYINEQSSVAKRRHRIEHCSECPPQLLERLSKLRALVVTQPPFLYYSGERYLATLSPSQLQSLYRIKSFLSSGLTVAASSDCPVVPANPLVGLYGAITRQAASGQRLLPEECISASQALALYTTNAAYSSFEEDIKGSITRGKLADMVVLSGDPIKSPPEEVKDIKVEMTIIDGEVVWEA